MPKSKPTQVIVHRIELQEKERELIEQYLKANEAEQYSAAAKNATIPIVAAGAVVGAYFVADAIWGVFKKNGERFAEFVNGARTAPDPSMGVPFAFGPLSVARAVIDAESPERAGLRAVFGLG